LWGTFLPCLNTKFTYILRYIFALPLNKFTYMLRYISALSPYQTPPKFHLPTYKIAFLCTVKKATPYTFLRVSKSLSHIPQECHGTSLDVSPRCATRASSGEYRFGDVSGVLSLPNFLSSILCIFLEGCFSVQ
jgi:hypothetical protein